MLRILKKLLSKLSHHHDHEDGLPLPVPETLNLDTFSLGHSKIGQSPNPADSFYTNEPIFWIKNPDEGIELGIQDNTLEFVFLTIEKYSQPIIYQGAQHTLSTEITLEEFLLDFGEPYFNSSENDNTILFYEPLPGMIEIQAEFYEGKLSHLLVTSESVMADEERRLAFNVEKPWPPQPSQAD